MKLTDLEGVFASGIHCGIKPSKKDLAFIYVPNAQSFAGVFTQNRFCAACVDFNREVLKAGSAVKLLIVNSGNANAVTGKPGEENVRKTAKIAAEVFGCKDSEVVIASTGVIGKQLPMETLEKGILQLADLQNDKDSDAAAEAIMTTDLAPKSFGVQRECGDDSISIAGIAKGSGMIAPNMATMLGFLVTDVEIDNSTMQRCLKEAVDKSFNMMSVDTDTSTSDMVLLFSTGQKKLDDISIFRDALTETCVELAKQIARDGEGAQKLIEVCIEEAADTTQAQAIAKNVINSPLVKTAIHGADPNWGRVVMAIGKTPDIELDPNCCDLYFQGICVLKQGLPCEFDREQLCEKLREADIKIRAVLGAGKSSATAWGCDLSKGYIDINVDYN